MLDLLDRLLPNIGRYPLWARALFLSTIALVLASAGVYAALYNDASARLERSKVSLTITSVLTEEDARNAAEVTGGPALEGPFFATTRLQVDGAGYERRIPISQEVAPGKTDSFEIPLAAAASSRHRLTVRVLAGAEPAGAPRELELDILVPRPPAG